MLSKRHYLLNSVQKGRFFSTTGEILINNFQVNGAGSGEVGTLPASGNCKVAFRLDWTFPLNFAELPSGDGEQVYRKRVDLTNTTAFGNKDFAFYENMKGRKWLRLEVWDIAVNGAFTQTIWLK